MLLMRNPSVCLNLINAVRYYKYYFLNCWEMLLRNVAGVEFVVVVVAAADDSYNFDVVAVVALTLKVRKMLNVVVVVAAAVYTYVALTIGWWVMKMLKNPWNFVAFVFENVVVVEDDVVVEIKNQFVVVTL